MPLGGRLRLHSFCLWSEVMQHTSPKFKDRQRSRVAQLQIVSYFDMDSIHILSGSFGV